MEHPPWDPPGPPEALLHCARRLRDDWGLHGLPSAATGAAGPGAAPALTVEEKARLLEELAREVHACWACPLAQGRIHAVPGEGNPDARVVFVGEGPGEEEDRTGRPFVGPAGALLTAIIERGMGIPRSSVYICNVVKCRPPRNRDPEPEEIKACAAFLERQLDIVAPEVIVTLGRPASARILGREAPMYRFRGRKWEVDGRIVVPTYHPSYLLRREHEKPKVWEDIQIAMRVLGLPLPSQRKPER